MSIARINSIEFDAAEELQARLQFFENQAYGHGDGVECLIAIQTSETSLLAIIVYSDKETADKTLQAKEKLMTATKHKYDLYMEGVVKRLQLNKRIYKFLVFLSKTNPTVQAKQILSLTFKKTIEC